MGISIPEDMSVVACSITRQQDCYGIPLTADTPAPNSNAVGWIRSYISFKEALTSSGAPPYSTIDVYKRQVQTLLPA